MPSAYRSVCQIIRHWPLFQMVLGRKGGNFNHDCSIFRRVPVWSDPLCARAGASRDAQRRVQ